VPAVTDWNENAPVALVIALLLSVPFRNVTLAFGIAAPDWSITTPDTDCARAGSGTSQNNPIPRKKAESRFREIILPFIRPPNNVIGPKPEKTLNLMEWSLCCLSAKQRDPMLIKKPAGAVAVALILHGSLSAQSPVQHNPPKGQTSQEDSGTNTSPDSAVGTGTQPSGQQPKRILGIIPNYRAVSADTQLPPLSPAGNFMLATKDSFDYSSFLLAGVLSGIGQAHKSQPTFGQGAKGYGRYYWHSLADTISGNYFTEAIVPTIAREDPRYYTLGHGGFLHRTGYSISRIVITKTDSGHQSFNFSEIAGNGAAAGLSNLYYPQPERTWTKTYQKWAAQIVIDTATNMLKEFWPDVSNWLSGIGKGDR
jgi:hypothetical protein